MGLLLPFYRWSDAISDEVICPVWRSAIRWSASDGFHDPLAVLVQAAPVFCGHLQPLRDAVPICLQPFRT